MLPNVIWALRLGVLSLLALADIEVASAKARDIDVGVFTLFTALSAGSTGLSSSGWRPCLWSASGWSARVR